MSAVDIATIMAQAQREVGNLTRSMGFLVDNGRTMLPYARAYQWAMDSAEMQIMSGAISYNQAIRAPSSSWQTAASAWWTMRAATGTISTLRRVVQ